MDRDASIWTTNETTTTQHGMLVVWGHFARTIGLLKQLARVAIPQQTRRRAPQEKLAELLIGLLAGIEYLTDLNAGAAPLVNDPAVAAAWQLHVLADASGVSRTLWACDDATVAALTAVLDAVSAPFLQRAITDLRQHDEMLVLDADLTGRPVSSTSETFPGAAFGYMDGEVRLGYQLAQICLRTRLFGRQWLSAHHYPGDTVSTSCLLALVQAAEQRLACHPRRRTELVVQRLAACAQAIAALQAQIAEEDPRLAAQQQRIAALERRLQEAQAEVAVWQAAPLSDRQCGPYSRLSQRQNQIASWQGQLSRARQRLTYLEAVAARQRQQQQAQLAAEQAEWVRLQQRYTRFCQENAVQPDAPCCRLRLDAGFSSSENITELLELGYDIDTKSANPAVVQALLARVTPETAWTKVGKNAEMVAWPNYYLHTCPYPLRVALERFHTPKDLLHHVLIRYQTTASDAGPDLVAWFAEYNGRQTIEAGNKEEKTTFKVQHLMSRSPAGIRIQALLTVFAANFVRWADEWIRPRVEQSTRRFDTVRTSPKRLVRIAANSPATVQCGHNRQLLCFSPASSFGGVVIRLSDVASPQLPLFANDDFSSA